MPAGSTTTSPRWRPRRRRWGRPSARPSWDDDDYGAKVEALVADPPAAVSFTFGVPDAEVVRSLRAAGSLVAPHRDDARGGGPGAAGGADASACRAPRRAPTGAAWPTTTGPTRTDPSGAPVASVREQHPGAARGGGGRGRARTTWPTSWAAVRTLVQAGTAFLRCPESGAPRPHKEALADPCLRVGRR